MFRTTLKTLAVLVVIFVATTFTSNAQLPGGSFGIGAMFAGSSNLATGHFALNDNMDISVGLGYQSVAYDSDLDGYEAPDAETIILFEGALKYFLSKGKDVSPYIGGFLQYGSYPVSEGSTYEVTTSSFGLGAMFGGQVFIAKNFALYGHVAFGYHMLSEEMDPIGTGENVTGTETTLSLSGSGVGAVFYF